MRYCRWRTRLGRRGCATSFLCLSLLERFAPFWARISLDNSLLYFWAMRAILLIILIAFFGLYILEINLCHSLPPLCKGVKSWKRRMGVWAPLFYCNDVGRIQHWIETKILWNKIGFYGLIFLQFSSTNQVMQNLIPKLRETSIISKKPVFLSEKLKTLTSSNYHRF